MHDCSSWRGAHLYDDAMKRLRIPLALAVVTMTGVSAATCGGGESPPFDANANCQIFCVYEGSDNGNCPFPTCATGENLDQCPAGCIPEPIV
jgi:hypothetical protein